MRWCGVLALAAVASCGPRTGSWPTANPRSYTYASDPSSLFEAALTTFRLSGYEVTDYDDARLFIQVKSRVDGDVVAQSSPVWGGATATATRRVSFIGIQLFAPNSLMVSVSGYHVQSGRLDPRVAREIDQIVRVIYQNAGLSPPPM